MTYWYINKDKIIKSNPNKSKIIDKLENTEIFDTYKKEVSALKEFFD